MPRILFAPLLALLLLLPPCAARAATPGEVGAGEVLRDLRMDGLSAPPRNLAAFRGKPLLINVWASWCGPCRAEMASLNRLAQRYGGRQFNLIGISTDDDAEAAYRFLERVGIGFDNFIDRRLALENMLGANRIPLTVLVDPRGRVLSKHYGGREWDSAESLRLIEQAFKVRL